MIQQLRLRGDTYLDETLRIGNIASLLSADKLKTEFEYRVVNDTANQIDMMVSGVIDWLVDKNTREWKPTLTSLRSRGKAESSGVLGDQFVITRTELLESIGNSVTRVVRSYDKEHESYLLAGKIRSSMMQAVAIAGASALGLGALLSVSLLDFTGIIGASALAAGGLAIIPYRRASVKKEFHSKIDGLHTSISATLDNHFQHELFNSVGKIKEAFSPFSSTSLVNKEKSLNLLLTSKNFLLILTLCKRNSLIRNEK